ncbi:MAG: hypothetical protein ABIJ09_19520 [Pseudomonadota bacterium]
MFVPAPELRRVAAPAERLVAVIESINAPNVVIPGSDAEPTQAMIVGVRNPDASFSVLIYLFQTQSLHPAIYVGEPRSVPLAQYPEVEAEAIQFVESMGFMIDNVNFRRLGPAQQAAVLERLPCFHDDPGAWARARNKGSEVPAALDGLEGLEDPAPLAMLEPLDELEDLPMIQAQLTDGAESALGAAIDNILGVAASPGLSDEERARLARLLAAF